MHSINNLKSAIIQVLTKNLNMVLFLVLISNNGKGEISKAYSSCSVAKPDQKTYLINLRLPAKSDNLMLCNYAVSTGASKTHSTPNTIIID